MHQSAGTTLVSGDERKCFKHEPVCMPIKAYFGPNIDIHVNNRNISRDPFIPDGLRFDVHSEPCTMPRRQVIFGTFHAFGQVLFDPLDDILPAETSYRSQIAPGAAVVTFTNANQQARVRDLAAALYFMTSVIPLGPLESKHKLRIWMRDVLIGNCTIAPRGGTCNSIDSSKIPSTSLPSNKTLSFSQNSTESPSQPKIEVTDGEVFDYRIASDPVVIKSLFTYRSLAKILLGLAYFNPGQVVTRDIAEGTVQGGSLTISPFFVAHFSCLSTLQAHNGLLWLAAYVYRAREITTGFLNMGIDNGFPYGVAYVGTIWITQSVDSVDRLKGNETTAMGTETTSCPPMKVDEKTYRNR